MGLLRILLGALGLGAALSQDAVGTTGCTASSCVLSNPSLRFGTGAENSVNAYGLFQQPWYFSHIANTWYKLTYDVYPLDTAIGMGTGSTQWSGATVVDLYTQSLLQASTDYSSFIVDSADTTKSVGHGKIVSTRVFTILGNTITLQNTFSLGANDSFVKIVTRFTNNATATINNVIIWTGTRDDFVGVTDSNMKTRGNLNTGAFVAVTSNTEASHAIMITNANEGVLFYSETPGVMTAYAFCCSFSNVYNTDPLSLAPSTPTDTDGSYAAVLPLGNVAVGASASITWYYAAGAVTSLSTVAGSVAAAQVADACPSETPSVTPSPSVTPTGTVSPSSSRTVSRTVTGTATGTSTETGTGTGTLTNTVTGTLSGTVSGTVSVTVTPTVTPTTTYTALATVSRTPTSSVTASPTGSQTAAIVVAQPQMITLQFGKDIVPNLIAINVATTAFIFGVITLCVCCGFIAAACRRRTAKECNYCNTTLKKKETLVEHLKTCDEYKKAHVRRSEVYKNMKAAWA